MVVHNRYRSGMPSGENQVVDRERAALVSLGHEVVRFERHSDEIAGWPVAKKSSLPARVVWSRESYQELRAALGAARPDVVHLHNTFPLLSPAVLYACRAAGVPVVVTLHNYRLMCAGGSFFRAGAVCHDCLRGPAVQAVVHGCYRGSRLATAPVVVANMAHRRAWRSMVSAYVFISASQRDLLAGLGLAQDRVFVRHNLIPRRTTQPAAPDDIVVFAGRLEESKGTRLLMAGWDSYCGRSAESGSRPGGRPRLRLVIAGKGGLEDEVSAWAATRPSVDMIGQLDNAECAELMGRARAVLLPSVWEEPFGLVAVEAMAAGTPPIAAGHGAFTELITPGVDGVLFPPGDAEALGAVIADVQGRPEQYQAYGTQARETYQKRFDPDRNLEQLLEIYRFAIANPA
jgi:glycosyltransferase involved in cell wall biosynthesis